jgi:hypothetical protein
MPRKAPRVSRRQTHLLLFRVIPALLAAAALVAASLAGWAFLAGSAVFAGSTLTGCPNGDSGLVYTPITGIEVEASTLVAGYGCGTGPGQVYKYAVLVTYENEAGPETYAAYSGVFDCYTNAIFSNLQPDDAGSLSFVLQVYAFNQASYPTVLENLAFADDAGAVEQVAPAANWTTTCTATQQTGISTVALCQPLEPVSGLPDAGAADADAGPTEAGAIQVDTHGFVLAEGGAITCGGQPEAGVLGYDSVTASFGQTITVTCPAPIRIAPDTAGANYAIAVSMAEGDAQVATAQCSATGVAGQTVTAMCGPATLSGP